MSCEHEHCNCSEDDRASGRAAHSHGDEGSGHGHGCCGGDHSQTMAAGQPPARLGRPEGGPSDAMVER